MNQDDNFNQKTVVKKETLINKIKRILKRDNKSKSQKAFSNELNDILNRLNQDSNLNSNKEQTPPPEKFMDKVKNLFKKKEAKKLIIAIATLIIAIVILIISINLVSKSNKDEVSNPDAWKDFSINIDGNIIKLGEKISIVETMGFAPTDEYRQYYKGTLEEHFSSGRLAFGYKESKQYPTIFFAARNTNPGSQAVSQCELTEIEVQQAFYNQYEVILPGRISLTKELTIDDIIKKWGEATSKDENIYTWTHEEKEIKIYINENKSILNLVYDS